MPAMVARYVDGLGIAATKPEFHALPDYQIVCRTPSLAGRDPEKVLSMINPEYNTLTCVGYDPSRGRRCRIPIGSANHARARDLLARMASIPPPTSDELEDLLLELAGAALCVRYHQNQKHRVAQQWTNKIQAAEFRAAAAAFSNSSTSSMKAIEDASSTPTKPIPQVAELEGARDDIPSRLHSLATRERSLQAQAARLQAEEARVREAAARIKEADARVREQEARIAEADARVKEADARLAAATAAQLQERPPRGAQSDTRSVGGRSAAAQAAEGRRAQGDGAAAWRDARKHQLAAARADQRAGRAEAKAQAAQVAGERALRSQAAAFRQALAELDGAFAEWKAVTRALETRYFSFKDLKFKRVVPVCALGSLPRPPDSMPLPALPLRVDIEAAVAASRGLTDDGSVEIRIDGSGLGSVINWSASASTVTAPDNPFGSMRRAGTS